MNRAPITRIVYVHESLCRPGFVFVLAAMAGVTPVQAYNQHNPIIFADEPDLAMLFRVHDSVGRIPYLIPVKWQAG